MRNTGLEEAQAGIKIAGRNTNNLRYADTLMAESGSEVKLLSCIRLFVTPWTVAHQDSPSMEFSRHEYWSGLPFPSPGDLPNPGIEPGSPALQADALPSEPPGNLPRLISQYIRQKLCYAMLSHFSRVRLCANP